MATGRSNKLVGQVGEFLVCAELGRRGLIATPFAGNVPGYDLIATNESCRSVPIQVKANNGSGAWLFRAEKYLDIEVNRAAGTQVVHGAKTERFPESLAFVFVRLRSSDSNSLTKDRFFILEWRELREVMLIHYRTNLAKHGGRRPKKPETTHMALFLPELEPFENRWDVIERQLACQA